MTDSTQLYTSEYNTKKELATLTTQLEQGVKEVFQSERYKEYLKAMSKFHNYSAQNVLLILSQNKEATFVHGYKAWKRDFSRNVKKGENGIKIIAPIQRQKEIRKERIDITTGKVVLGEDGNPIMDTKTITIPSFKVATVFDISQTYGQPLPTIATELKKNVDNFQEIVTVLKEVSSVPIEFKPLKKVNGYYNDREKVIVIKNSLSEEHQIKTIIHELAHSTLHNSSNKIEIPDSRTREVQAESIAYIVCQHFGIDSSEYSFGYISSWSSSKELKELKQSLSTIQKTSDYLISNIEMKLKECNLLTANRQKGETLCIQKKQTYKRNTTSKCKSHARKH